MRDDAELRLRHIPFLKKISRMVFRRHDEEVGLLIHRALHPAEKKLYQRLLPERNEIYAVLREYVVNVSDKPRVIRARELCGGQGERKWRTVDDNGIKGPRDQTLYPTHKNRRKEKYLINATDDVRHLVMRWDLYTQHADAVPDFLRRDFPFLRPFCEIVSRKSRRHRYLMALRGKPFRELRHEPRGGTQFGRVRVGNDENVHYTALSNISASSKSERVTNFFCLFIFSISSLIGIHSTSSSATQSK